MNVVKKTLMLGIIALFIGVSVIPATHIVKIPTNVKKVTELEDKHWVSLTGDYGIEEGKPPEIEVVTSENNRIGFEVNVFGMYVEKKVENGKFYDDLTIPEATLTDRTGGPSLPIITVLVAIPKDTPLDLQVSTFDHQILDGYDIIPTPSYQQLKNDNLEYPRPIYLENNTTYNRDQWYPNTHAKIEYIGFLREQCVAKIQVFPVAFNPVKKQLKIVNHLRADLYFSNVSGIAGEGLGPFEDIGSILFLNYERYSASPLCSPPPVPEPKVSYPTDLHDPNNRADYLMIVADDLYRDTNLQTFADWRCNHTRLDIAIVPYSYVEEQFSDDSDLDTSTLHDDYSSGKIPLSTCRPYNSLPNIPSNPHPLNGADHVDIDSNLSWTGGDPDPGDSVTYDVYFGLQNPPPKVVNNQSEITYEPEILFHGMTYYWQIIAWDTHNAYAQGPVWSFNTDNGAQRIKNFIDYVYNNWTSPHIPDYHLAYVLLVGDGDGKPGQILPTHSRQWGFEYTAEDMWFGCVKGDDNLPDIMVGRFPVKTSKELEIITNKTRIYEQDAQLHRDENGWRHRILILQGYDENQQTSISVDNTAQIVDELGYTKSIVRVLEQITPPNQWTYETINEINKGSYLLFYYDHGDPFRWDKLFWPPNDMNFLVNEWRLPIIFSMACSTGKFHNDIPYNQMFYYIPIADNSTDCLGERFLNRTTWGVGPSEEELRGHGAVAFFGSSIPASYNSFNLAIDSLKAFANYHIAEIGKIIVYGVIENGGCLYYNLLGDPALDLRESLAYPDMPNLVISKEDLEISQYINREDPVIVEATIHNSGGTEVEETKVTLFVEGTLSDICTIGPIPPEGFQTTELLWYPPSGFEWDMITFSVEVDLDNLVIESWEGDNNATITVGIAAHPFEPGWPIQVGGDVYSSPALADLNGDGSTEIIVGSEDGKIYVWQADGSHLYYWPQDIGSPIYASPAVDDLDGDGYCEVVAAGINGQVCVWKWNGLRVEGWPINIDATIESSPVLANLDDNTDLEIIICSYFSQNHRHLIAYNMDGSIVDGWESLQIQDWIIATPAIGDVDGDSYQEVVVKTKDLPPKIMILNQSGTVEQQWSMPYLFESWPPSSPALVDIDDDNDLEIIVGAGKYLFAYHHDSTPVEGWENGMMASNMISNSPAIGDVFSSVNDDLDIVVGCEDGELFMWNEHGEGYWPYWPVTTLGEVRSSPALGDIDGDGFCDVIVGSTGFGTYAWNRHGNPLQNWPLRIFEGVRSSPAIGDIDNDGKVEIAIGSLDNYVFVWEQGSCIANPHWPMFHHNPARTGLYTPPNTKK